MNDVCHFACIVVGIPQRSPPNLTLLCHPRIGRSLRIFPHRPKFRSALPMDLNGSQGAFSSSPLLPVTAHPCPHMWSASTRLTFAMSRSSAPSLELSISVNLCPQIFLIDSATPTIVRLRSQTKLRESVYIETRGMWHWSLTGYSAPRIWSRHSGLQRKPSFPMKTGLDGVL